MHDAKGRPLAVGDLVMVPMRVVQTSTAEEYCNVGLDSVATMPPYPAGPMGTTHMSTINTKQILRANEGDDLIYTVVEQPDGQIRIG